MKEMIENFRDQGEIVECGIEVTTNSYSDGDIAGKELYSEIINVPVSYVSA